MDTRSSFCPVCENTTDQIIIIENEKFEVRGETIEVATKSYRCTSCDSRSDDPSDPDPLQEVYREYRRRKKIPQPEDIRALRKRYGLTQSEFGAMLGFGTASLSRYENGSLPDEAHAGTLCLAMNPINLANMIERAGSAILREKRDKIYTLMKDEAISSSLLSFLTSFIPGLTQDNEPKLPGYGPPSFLNGLRSLNINKLFNTILFFCRGEGEFKTKLNKLLFYADFICFRNHGHSITGLQYARIDHGPVPDNFQLLCAIVTDDQKIVEVKEEVFSSGASGERFKSRKEPDISVFSNNELAVLTAVQQRFAGMSSTKISALSHEEDGYKKTSHAQLINYKYAETLKI